MILVVGSVNVDYVAFVHTAPLPGETVTGTRFATHPGGKGANQAFAAARLGAEVALVARVGDDAQGSWLRAHLDKGGVGVEAVAVEVSASTGVALIVVDARGQNSIVVAPGANGTLTPETVHRVRGLFDRARVVLLQLETPLETVIAAAQQAREAGCTVLLDPAPARPLPDALLRLVDYLTPNETELLRLSGLEAGAVGQGGLTRERAAGLAQGLRARGAAAVVAKLGAAGALLVGAAGKRHAPARAVPVVDTTAAGDVFNAAFAVALVGGAAENAALGYAVEAATWSVTREGAQSSMPAAADVRRW